MDPEDLENEVEKEEEEDLEEDAPADQANDDESEMPESEAEEDEGEEEDDDDEDDEDAILGDAGDGEIARQPFPQIEDDEDEDEDEDDENYLQKFDTLTQEKIISDFHPELQAHNYEEIDMLSRVVRDEYGNIIDPLHKTLPFITRYEKARILGERAKQINAGGKPFVEVDETVIDGYLIALKEFEEKKIPFIIKRPIPNGGCEYWRFADLEILA